MAMDVLAGRPVPDVAAQGGVETELVERWTELFVEGGSLRLAGQVDPSSFEARERFLVLAAHEFRTPLAVIRGWVETMQSGDLSDELLADGLGTVLRQVGHLERVTCDALDAGAVAQGLLHLVVGPLDLRRLVAAAVAATSPAAVVAGGPPIEVVGDAGRLRQVVEDLLAHAGRLARDDAPTVDIEDGEQVTVTVSVTGRALDFDEAAELFEPYGRSDTSSGTGLGLFLCRALSSAHGGEVGLRSEGETSSFWMRLPRAGPPPGPLVERR